MQYSILLPCLADFLAGFFFANAIPHFVHGISGNSFPTVFSKPRGIGPSSPTINVLWALFNLLAGYGLARLGDLDFHQTPKMIALFLGAALISLVLSKRFQHKQL